MLAHPPVGARPETRSAHREAIEDAVAYMRTAMSERITLQQAAQAAAMSRYHFSRVFQEVTGTTFGRYLTGLRIGRAKELLVSTSFSCASIGCLVGYGSRGTFTTRFTQLVGLPPDAYRRTAATWLGAAGAGSAVTLPGAASPGTAPPASASITGRCGSTPAACLAGFVGAFATPLPEGRPLACAEWHSDRDFTLGALPRGRFNVFAIGWPVTGRDRTAYPPEVAELDSYVGSLVVAVPDHALRFIPVPVRPREPNDPVVTTGIPVITAHIERRRAANQHGVRANPS